MFRYLSKRLAYYLVLVIASTFLTYLLASVALSPRANFEGRNPQPSPAAVTAQLNALGISDKKPVLERFGSWSAHALAGNLGETIDGTSVNAELGRRIGVTLRLLIIGTLAGTVIGVLLGAWSAVRQYRVSDHVITLVSFVILSTPPFLLAVLLKTGAIKFNQSTGTSFIKFTGEATPDLHGGVLTHLSDDAVHLLLPSLAIGLIGIATYTRYQRATMLDALGSDYIRTAQAKGLTRRKALFKHALRMALIPMSTFFAYNFLTIFTSAIFTEVIFDWNGINAWFVESIGRNDINSVVAVTLVTAIVVLCAGFLADVLHAALDPRVRHV